MEKRNNIPPLTPNVREAMQRYVAGTANEADRALVSAWYGTFDDDEVTVPADHPDEELLTKHRIWQNLQARRSAQQTGKIRRWLPYAAAAAVLLAVGWFLVDISDKPVAVSLAATEIGPGGNKATLTLADGRTIDLSSEQEGISVAAGVTYLDGSSVLGEQLNEGTDETTKSQVYTLTTPKGGTYRITLPDGSKVWLNAASTLKYPSRFVDKERVVELSGEAYFDIESVRRTVGDRLSSVPFKVITEGQTVEVLGTEFNIAAYTDDSTIKTTLVEGRVKVSMTGKAQAGASELILLPGKQSSLSTNGSLIASNANIKKETAWKLGWFHFENISVDDMMRQIGRWYDVEVRYDGNIPTGRFGGVMDRNVSLKTLLEYLQESGLHTKLHNRILTVQSGI